MDSEREIQLTPFPNVSNLAAEYRSRSDGKVTLPNGIEAAVTHPITQVGFACGGGVAAK